VGEEALGTAFHFMEPRSTLSDLQRIAAGGGVVAIAYSGSPMWPYREPWARALRSVLERRLGDLDDVDLTAEALHAAEETMRELGYGDVEPWEQIYVEPIDIDFVVGLILSATSTKQIPPARAAGLRRGSPFRNNRCVAPRMPG